MGTSQKPLNKSELLIRLRQFLESEARSCSMEPGLVTPEYIYRMWGGSVPLDEIKSALNELARSF